MDVPTPNRYLFYFYYNFSKSRNSTAVCVCKILATLESFFCARFKRITFKLSKITNIKALFTFQWYRRIFRQGHMSKVEKNRGSI